MIERSTLTMSTLNTQLKELGAQRTRLVASHASSGAHHRAGHAQALAATYQREMNLWARIADATGGLDQDLQEVLYAAAACALVHAARLRESWEVNARNARERAEQAERDAAQAFTSGMTYEPGRGVVRAQRLERLAAGLPCDADAADVR